MGAVKSRLSFIIVAVVVFVASPLSAQDINLKAEFAAIKRNPYLVVDLNRDRIVGQLLKDWGTELTSSYGSAEAAEAILKALPSSNLYAVAMANEFADVETAIRGNVFKSTQLKALGDANADFSYTPVTPCRLVDTRGTFAAVYRGDGTVAHNAAPFGAGETRTYAMQGANGVCLSQLPAGLNPKAVALQVFGIPTTAASGDIEILPQGSTFGSTATMVYISSIAFNTVSTIARINPGNNEISVQVRGGGAHLAIDVVGYFRQAIGSPASLQAVSAIDVITPFGINFLKAPVCPASTLLVSGGCSTDSFLVTISDSDRDSVTTANWVCAYTSISALTQSIAASTLCLDTPAKAN